MDTEAGAPQKGTESAHTGACNAMLKTSKTQPMIGTARGAEDCQVSDFAGRLGWSILYVRCEDGVWNIRAIFSTSRTVLPDLPPWPGAISTAAKPRESHL